MRTITLILISTIGMLTTSLLVSVVCLALAAFFFLRWEFKKENKIERSDDSFQKGINNECDCENPCNEYCAKKK